MQGASKRVQHHPAMPFPELPVFMEELRNLDEVKARALEFTILTAARTSEALKATWDEIDLDAKVWTIPVAASCIAFRFPKRIEILKSLPRDGSGWLFPGSRT